MDKILIHHAASSDSTPPLPNLSVIAELCDRMSSQTNILPLDHRVIVKFGNISNEEFQNQLKVYGMVDRKLIHVPEIFQYFSRGSTNYLVMERVHGTQRDLIEDDLSVSRIADIVHYLQTFSSDRPGPLGGGVSRGLLWENEEACFDTVSMLEEYLNRRMLGEKQRFELDPYDLVLCHLDVAPRNIIWMENGSICLLDWATAGYYPKLAERAVLLINIQEGKDLKFTTILQERLGQLTLEQNTQLSLIHRAWFNSHRYSIRPLKQAHHFYNKRYDIREKEKEPKISEAMRFSQQLRESLESRHSIDTKGL